MYLILVIALIIIFAAWTIIRAALLALAVSLVALPISTLTPLRGIVGLLTIPSPAIGLAAHIALLGLHLIELVAIATRSRVENQFVVLYVGAQLQKIQH